MSNLLRWKVTCLGEKDDGILHHIQDLLDRMGSQDAAIAISAQLKWLIITSELVLLCQPGLFACNEGN